MNLTPLNLPTFSSRTRKIRREAKRAGIALSYKEARLKKTVNRHSYLSTDFEDLYRRLKDADISFDFLFRSAYGKLKHFKSKGERNVFFNIPILGFSQYAIRIKRRGLKILEKLLKQEKPHYFEITPDKKYTHRSGLPLAKIIISNKAGKHYVIEEGNSIFGEVMPFVPGSSLAQLAKTVGYMGSRVDSDPKTHLKHSNETLNRLLKLPQSSYLELLEQLKASARHPDFGLGNIILTPDKRLVMIDPHPGTINTLQSDGEAKFSESLTRSFGKFLHEQSDPNKLKKVLNRFTRAYREVFQDTVSSS